ncbi:hypothetical protein CPA50_02055 [Marinobacter sp. ANT_B65]|nr:hypothetical protein CPA50_02055 [Marinobacter sp. ANT_B65]
MDWRSSEYDFPGMAITSNVRLDLGLIGGIFGKRLAFQRVSVRQLSERERERAGFRAVHRQHILC